MLQETDYSHSRLKYPQMLSNFSKQKAGESVTAPKLKFDRILNFEARGRFQPREAREARNRVAFDDLKL